ncbi:protein TASOR isoform X2 [Anas platyrhynchos]|uniref:protein TASOR isoform X2 n=1 Tax=Anas platyrhynchos TaxID=8839 RepID=UPI000F7C1BFA|nr:protein TASOR isoform X2 [Anas platyrhynchos]|eukprot:XP_027323359.1 protein TASOR isoform X3 [Anas platyrhynchos]
MADAAISGGGEMELEQQQRPEKSGAGLLGAESNRAGAAEDATQNGGRSEGSGGGEALLVAAVAAEDKGPPNLSITSGSQRRSSVSAAPEQQQQQPPPSDALGGSPPLPKPPEDVPVRRNFQIPRKSREKKALFQPVAVGSREFEDVVKILHSSYLEPSSVSNFNYKRASLVHSELLEKEFTEKRRELKFDGRLDKELSETYAFLMVDRPQIQSICEKGLQVGHSKITILGSPSMGVYISRYADLLQPNPLEAGATGDVIVFKIIKGKMKSIYDHIGMKAVESTVKSALDPTPKHECHVSKNANKVTSLLAYRAYELTQYYFYEYGFDEIRRRPRHVCPYAVVSFTYKDEIVQTPKFLPPSRSNSFNTERSTDKSNYTLWRGQLWNKGKLLCHVSLKSAARPFLPCKLPEKLDVEKVVSIDQLKKKISPALLYKETYLGAKEVLKNGMYCSLYEVVEKSRSGNHLEGLLQKLEKEKLVLVKPLLDRGFLFLLSPWQMTSPYDHQTGRSRMLNALFLFPEPRGIMSSTQKIVPFGTQKNSTTVVLHENQEIIPEFTKFIQSLHFALIQSRKDATADFNTVVEKYINEYLKRCYSGSGKYREFVLYRYESRLDDKKFLYSAPKNKSHIDSSLQNYIFGCEAYQLPVSRAKELMEGNRKLQQFSPISDYEATEDTDFANAKSGKRIRAKYEATAAKRKFPHHGDYDPDRLKELINLIQCRKKNVGGDSDSEDLRNKSGLKRKLEKQSENLRKHLKMSEASENSCQYEGGRTSDSPHSVFSIITGLGGHDTDLRQQDVSDSAVTDTHGLIKLLLETLASSGHLDSSLARSVNQALGLNTDEIEEDMRQKYEYESIPAQDRDDHELPNAVQAENVNFKDPQSPVMLETDAACLPYPTDVDLRLSANEVGLEHTLRLKEASTGSVSSFEDYSPCPSTPIEHVYRRQHSNSNNIGEVGMHWRLIPITDTQKGTAEDGLYTRQVEKLEDQCGLADQPFTTKHSISAIIETTLLEEYNLFAKKIQEILQQKNIAYVSGMSTPVFSARERIMRLSEYICLQASEISVQEYIETLSEKLNSVILSSSSTRHTQPIYSSPESTEMVRNAALNPSPEVLPACRDCDPALLSEPLCNNVMEDLETKEQHSASLPLAKEEMDRVNAKTEDILTSDQTSSSGDLMEQPEKTQKSPESLNISSQPALSDFISQLKPEVFNSLVKIIKDVQKNTVKFYIHEEEESILCKEIKEYLTKLGNTECHPEQFLKRRADLDKLLIIIQNEDIANLIHKIPGLVTLKRLSCVSFAGVDSLDDVKNHTYNELFVSGGFVVSDESVLNPESITIDKLKQFLKFLEDLNTPDGKWQWKVHCKIQKKLKELGRLNTNALSLLTLLNTYQKKHLVEILSYHHCDSQTRNAPELDCLIRLQAQNIQQRHVVFLTEKNLKMLSNYAENGIVVATVDDFMQNFKSLVGYHNSVTEDNSLPPSDVQKRQSVLVENDEKDEEDMSLDSGDEASQIEICNDDSKYDTCRLEALQTEAKGSHGVDTKESCVSAPELPPEAQIGLMEKTSKIDLKEIQPIPPVSTTCSAEGGKQNSVEQAPSSNFQVYSRQLNMSHQFSQFNLLTHQTFLGTTYPISANQNQEGGNYFLSAYSQSMDTEKSSSPGGWDINCDSSRPYSKQK